MGLGALAIGLTIVLVLVLAWSKHYRRTKIQLTLEVRRTLHGDEEECDPSSS